MERVAVGFVLQAREAMEGVLIQSASRAARNGTTRCTTARSARATRAAKPDARAAHRMWTLHTGPRQGYRSKSNEVLLECNQKPIPTLVFELLGVGWIRRRSKLKILQSTASKE